ncbi:MAG: hypothetical protein WDM88_01790 [Galbitalea sp.]
MAQLSAHPYIVTIFQAAVADDDRPYLVMEYCSGPSLAEQYKKQPPVGDPESRDGRAVVERDRDRPRRVHPAPGHQAGQRVDQTSSAGQRSPTSASPQRWRSSRRP